MKVIAKAGLRVPKEGAPRKYITDREAVVVPDSVYYTRRVMDGDLVRQDDAPAATETPAAGEPADDPASTTGADAKKTAKGA
ncbi:hypothetical protein [Burkholderia vietnamiensis]|uniref:hypothetical protein n=1 Tax=Burkholderia vietnamiensis TaxID=60552 RepID=UPI001589C1A3|nr:hypothetical protein [Burkholderia vietnamiensis]MCA8183829.1 hypothetical protein [Burkholderia vietnamiensis]